MWEEQISQYWSAFTEREESQESWQKTFTCTSYHLQVASWSWERTSKILLFVLVQEHWKLKLPFTWKKPGAVADFLSWQNVPHDSRGSMANGGGSACLGRVLNTVPCSREGSWRPSSLFLLRCPPSGRTSGPKGWRYWRMTNAGISPPSTIASSMVSSTVAMKTRSACFVSLAEDSQSSEDKGTLTILSPEEGRRKRKFSYSR